RGIRLWPPASTFASSPCSPRRASASSRVDGRWYSNAEGSIDGFPFPCPELVSAQPIWRRTALVCDCSTRCGNRQVPIGTRWPRRRIPRLRGMGKPALPPAIESPLVIASNRGPVTFERDATGGFEAQRGAGGLVTTLSGVFYRDEATWVSAAMSEADRVVPDEAAND